MSRKSGATNTSISAASPFVINPAPPLAPAAIIEAFRHASTPNISDNLQRLPGICGLQRYHRSKKLVGTAFTVKTRPGDNVMIYRALKDLSGGHVLVVDGAGDCTNALIGELIMRYALQHGCAGFVLDAAIRDSVAFFVADFPCYARGVSHRGPHKHGPGAINVPVTVRGQVVLPGDVVVGDEDGIVTFPLKDAEGLLHAARKTAATEDLIRDEIATGRRQQSWLDQGLAPYGL